MHNSFLFVTFLYFIPFIVLVALYGKALYSFTTLYRKKKNPDYPILPGETAQYLFKGALHKILMSPFFMIKIIFEKHKDKGLDVAARKVRLLMLSFLVVLVVQFIFLIILLF